MIHPKSLSNWTPYALAVLRIVAGLIFLEHGTQKLLADIRERIRDVRFAPESGHIQRQDRCLLCANSGHQKRPLVL